MQKAKYNLSIKVTKTFDQHDRHDQQLFKGVKTLKSHGIKASTINCEAMHKSWVSLLKITVTTDLNMTSKLSFKLEALLALLVINCYNCYPLRPLHRMGICIGNAVSITSCGDTCLTKNIPVIQENPTIILNKVISS